MDESVMRRSLVVLAFGFFLLSDKTPAQDALRGKIDL
jgi:hypothetical protein